MLIEEIRGIKSGINELRKFGMTIGVVVALLGGVSLWRGNNPFYFFAVSGIFILMGVITPALLKPIQKIWMTLAVVMGFFVTRVILSALFYLVITPIGLLAKLTGKDFLDMRFNKNTLSYWIKKEEAEFDKTRYERQF